MAVMLPGHATGDRSSGENEKNMHIDNLDDLFP